ncbi:MAG: L,D-transpeptidase ErfK/SrfK [Solirubrobacteraceae bacterium]|nr:L,D-transpeptidase ErfK/SrfK [Solirubrobacteraceae bacterium]
MLGGRQRRWWVLGALCVLVLAGAAGAAAAYDHGRRDRLAEGIRIGSVDVGGLDVDVAAQRVHRLAVEPRRRSLRVHAHGRTFELPAGQLRVTGDVAGAVARAHADSRRGWLGSRVARELSGGHVDEQIPLVTHYAPGVIAPLVEKVAASTDRKPVDATVIPTASGLKKTHSRAGLAVDTRALRVALARAAASPARPADITAPTHPVAAQVDAEDLEAKYPAYIVIDRKAHQLRFYSHLALARSYDIAVGKSGLETPGGLYDIQWKEVNPSWRVPNSAWAGDLAGQTIPPGPRDPIKARWMAFNGGAGIHGIDPSEYGSIGHDASHGCVRMRIPDVIALYARSPVGTPVYVA